MSQQDTPKASEVKHRFKDRKLRQGKRKLQVWLPEEVYNDLDEMRDMTGVSKTKLLSTMIPLFKQQIQETQNEEQHRQPAG